VADIELWNCTNDLVGDSMFYDWGSSLMIYGGSGNVIWGNEFLPYLVPLKPSISSVSLFFVTSRVLGEVGLSVYSSNNIIYNNYFGVNVPVYSPSYNIYTGTYTIYTNLWNITPEPASYINIVNGYDLTGNILGGAIQSGNYWSNYVSSAPLPFNSYGYIATGGDYNPIVPVYYTVSMTISGLNSTVLAFLYSNAQNHMFLYSAFGSGTLNIEATNGTYYVLILTTTGIYSSVPAQITVNGANVTITVTLSDQTIIL
jgi:thermopsin